MDMSTLRCHGPLSHCFLRRKEHSQDEEDSKIGQEEASTVLNDMSLKARLAFVNSMKGKTYSLHTGFALARKDALDMIALLRVSVGSSGEQADSPEVSGADTETFSQLLLMQAKVLSSACSRMVDEYGSPEELLLTLTHSFHTLCCLAQACMSLVDSVSSEVRRRELVARVEEVVISYVSLLKAAEAASGRSPSDQSIHVAVLGLWCFIPASTAEVVYPKLLPCNVTEPGNSSDVVVDCTETNLKFIPAGIPRETTNLTLTINHIHTLNSSSFHGLDNLTEIDFRCNCVPVKIGPKDNMCLSSVAIEDNTFSGLENLKALYLDGNQLYEIPKDLPPNLLLLSLEAVGSAVFPRWLGKLEELDLSFNYDLQRYPQTLFLSLSFSELKSLKFSE
ncbi:hypothetical protein WMY93_002544 [Mugilogobius chulae]|uniref:Uncharacterized protein n=1 Tax=Mugilogobius chulae TaxID=88201 RepID=A0AAW0PU69_9GOBI